jgi:hypothetical protein
VTFIATLTSQIMLVVSSSLFSTQLSQKIAFRNIIIKNCTFNNARAFQVFTTDTLTFENITISESIVSSNDLLYFENVNEVKLQNIIVKNLNKPIQKLLGNSNFSNYSYRRCDSCKDREHLSKWD